MYYPRSVLHHPLCSAWRKLVSSKDDPLLIQATRLDFWIFRFLLHRFAPIYEKYSFYFEDGRIKGEDEQRPSKESECRGSPGVDPHVDKDKRCELLLVPNLWCHLAKGEPLASFCTACVALSAEERAERKNQGADRGRLRIVRPCYS